VPPRHAYWTIIVGNLPTAFRAANRDELLPTFERLRERHPDAVMRWFARGRLWESPEAARRVSAAPVRKTRDWRPGGEHRDPRDRFRRRGQRRPEGLRERPPGSRPMWKHDDAGSRSQASGSGRPSRKSGGRPRPRVGGQPPPRPHEDQPGLPRPPAPKPPPGPDRPPRPGAEPPPVPSQDEEIVIPPEPPERGRGRGRRHGPARPPRR
jgi:hypothetical protein